MIKESPKKESFLKVGWLTTPSRTQQWKLLPQPSHPGIKKGLELSLVLPYGDSKAKHVLSASLDAGWRDTL